jgi:hypothetical protein
LGKGDEPDQKKRRKKGEGYGERVEGIFGGGFIAREQHGGEKGIALFGDKRPLSPKLVVSVTF